MTVTTTPLIELEFFLNREYGSGRPDPVFTTQSDRTLPIPSEGECVTFGRVYGEDGEELDRWHYMGSSTDYERSERYRVMAVEYHYHNARETDDAGNFVTRRPEVGVDIIIERELSV